MRDLVFRYLRRHALIAAWLAWLLAGGIIIPRTLGTGSLGGSMTPFTWFELVSAVIWLTVLFWRAVLGGLG